MGNQLLGPRLPDGGWLYRIEVETEPSSQEGGPIGRKREDLSLRRTVGTTRVRAGSGLSPRGNGRRL